MASDYMKDAVQRQLSIDNHGLQEIGALGTKPFYVPTVTHAKGHYGTGDDGQHRQ